MQCAKEAGTSVTCEVSPHHLVLTEQDIRDYNTHFKFHPPLRPAADVEALVAGFIDGSIDVLACDHAPHTEFEKSSEFGSAPFGAAGLETTVPVMFDRFIRKGVFGWDLLIERYSAAPRRLVGLAAVAIVEGTRAEFFLFDPEGETPVTRETMKTKSPVSPSSARPSPERCAGRCWGRRGILRGDSVVRGSRLEDFIAPWRNEASQEVDPTT